MDRSPVNESAREPLLSRCEERVNGESSSYSFALFKGEIKKLLAIALPMIAMNMLQSSLQLVSMMIVGHIDELSLSSVSMATSFANVTGFSFLVGLASGLDTLSGQAFGAKQYRLHGILLQRAVFILFCISIPLSIMWLFMEHILLAFGQDPSIAFNAGVYAKWLIPSLFAHVFIQPLIKYLQTQSIVIPLMLSSACALIVHAPLCWFLVYKVGLGIKGAALSMNASYLLNLGLLLLYVKFSAACRKTRVPISTEAFHDVKNFLQVTIPSTVMMCLEWWSFELLILLSGILPSPELETSVISICFNTASFGYMIAYGLAAAASTRVSNELGAGNTPGAILAARSVMCISATEVLIRGITLFSIRNVWGHVFSNDSDVIRYMATMMPLLALTSMMDGLQGVLSGIARGCGLQKWGAFANLSAYYLVGLPLAIFLAFAVNLAAKGLWLGILGGLLVQTILLTVVDVCHDWNEVAKVARERVYESALPIEQSHITKVVK